MSQDDKPIFPRSTESSEEEQRKLREQARLNLENAEKTFDSASSLQQKNLCPKCETENRSGAKFCQGCASPLIADSPQFPAPVVNNFPPTPNAPWKNDDMLGMTTVYGPPPMRIEDETPYSPPRHMPPPPVYGPPPMPLPFINRKYLGVIIAGGILLLAAALIIILAVFLIFLHA